MKTREIIYAILAVIGAAVPLYYDILYMLDGGNLLPDYFTVPMGHALTASSLFDLVIAFAAYNVFLFDKGLAFGKRNFIICLLTSWLVAFSAGLPLFLMLYERQERLETSGDSA